MQQLIRNNLIFRVKKSNLSGLSVGDHGFMISNQAPTHNLFLIEVRSHLSRVGAGREGLQPVNIK